ncbi:MAG: aspartyl-phosphate phosphatase Spo0E family protein [Clostridia bacterium]|nr:aspartyl-phosphate phosphatase Spo0E family protein [Clostridia bacterium]
MSKLEFLREKLYKVIEKGSCEDILKASQELDRLILFYMKQGKKIKRVPA